MRRLKVKKDKKPSWWNFVARHDYNLLKKSYHEVQSRILPKEESEDFDVSLPEEWKSQPLGWFLRAFGKKELPHGSGFGFVQSPFSDIFRKSFPRRMDTLRCME